MHELFEHDSREIVKKKSVNLYLSQCNSSLVKRNFPPPQKKKTVKKTYELRCWGINFLSITGELHWGKYMDSQWEIKAIKNDPFHFLTFCQQGEFTRENFKKNLRNILRQFHGYYTAWINFALSQHDALKLSAAFSTQVLLIMNPAETIETGLFQLFLVALFR